MECVLNLIYDVFSVENRGVKEFIQRNFKSFADFINNAQLHTRKFAVEYGA